MPKHYKITQYMREQIAGCTPEELRELIGKIKFTPEQRKAILSRIGEIEKDPQSTPAEVKNAEKVREIVEDLPEPEVVKLPNMQQTLEEVNEGIEISKSIKKTVQGSYFDWFKL